MIFSQEQTNTLERVIHLSETKKVEVPDRSFYVGISREHFWSPKTINPWFYLPSYSKLPSEVQLRYNQLHALCVNEIFCYFEQGFIKIILKNKLNEEFGKNGDLLAKAMGFFCDEEDRHTEMFWRLNESAAPEFYPSRKFQFIDTESFSAKARDFVVMNFTSMLLFWVWVAIFFEERTLMYSVEYAKKNHENLSPQFKFIHEQHMIEEARHVQMDEIFIELFFRDQSWFKQKIGALMFEKVLSDFSVPKRSTKKIVQFLKKEFNSSEIHAQIDACVAELPLLATHQEYRRLFFGPASAPRTYRHMNEFGVFGNASANF
jgi:hypothetical protein